MAARTIRTGAVGLAAAAALVAASFTSSAAAGGAGDHQQTQAAMDAAVDSGVPGVSGQVKDNNSIWMGTSGVGDVKTGEPRSGVDRYRIGSMTKTFVATVLLQLESEGKLDLDDKVDTWLPGVVEGNGHDGRQITVRQLLNHTSGIFSYTGDAEFLDLNFTEKFLEHRYDTYTPQQLVDMAMRHEPTFEPGAGWSYSNTNYVLAGMIIEKVSGHSYETEIERRIIGPLDLTATSVPRTGTSLPEPSSRAYSKLSLAPQPTDPTHDITELNPSVAGAAGAIISDSGDLNRFYSALFGGKLLPAAQLEAMKTTVPVEGAPFQAYGLGLMKSDLSCGTSVWGHGGNIQGSASQAVATADGKHALAFNFNGDWAGDSQAVIEAEYCPQ
ncbi:D-alanyl-D-alanine carboxypeptidase precursor [Streptomyces sp. YIM 130001]|uniref:serine hydrolase domain-containing protein n=1 Tax=Streptomyces sp. YIM 130001 TaxID=2259644 RepID=UPI000E654534|nr:serine hydrolase domain-containing protein [Streptomyces sp. YIM 130001]RII17687.1 D-alanyl-D-alanine carboxypeptidase precursor [Streptomyces sp. YIM 130001]